MKVIKNTSQQMDELFNEARHEKPLMDLKEVENIVASGHYVPSVSTKGFHLGINTIIVMSGIIVTSLLTYMTLQVDKQDVPSKNSSIVTSVEKNPVVEPSAIQYSENAKKPAINQKNKKLTPVSSSVKKSDIERPKVNSDQSVASIDNSILAVNNAAEQKEVLAENNDQKADVSSALAMNKKILSGEFMISFNYNDQEVEIKLSGDDISLLEVDDRIISPDKYSDYDNLISEGRNILAGKHSRPENNSLELISYFDSLLLADHILTPESKYVFELTSSQLLINRTAQSDDIFKKYKGLYETKTGKPVTSGSVYRFEKGAKSE